MSDSSDDMEFYSGMFEVDEEADFEIKRKAAIEYCYDNLQFMWAAKIVGILLGCDFKDAKEHADIYLDEV